MSDVACNTERLSWRLYQAYGLNGLYAEKFDLEGIERHFREKYGYKAKVIKITAGGGTCLAGPIRER